MKTMTCKALGGTCDQKLSADTWDGMVKAMTEHVMAKHPDVAKKMQMSRILDAAAAHTRRLSGHLGRQPA